MTSPSQATSVSGSDHSSPFLKESFGPQLRELTDRSREPIPAETLMRASFATAVKRESGVTLYNLPGQEIRLTPPSRPLKVAFLTSIRDVGVCESVGKFTAYGKNRSYIKGTLETALEAVNDERLGKFAEIVAVITDDLKKDLKWSDYVADPKLSGRWITPRDARNQKGERISSITVNIPSNFRALPLNDHEARHARKLQFESEVYRVMVESGADILLSDHFLARIDFLISPKHFGLLGKVLNTHPGITRADHPYATVGKLPYDLMRLHAKGLKQLPDNTVVKVTPCDIAGASFHLVTAGIDRGPVLCDGELTKISPNDTDVEVARKLYETSKYHVFIEGLRHYASNIYPLMLGIE